MRPNFIPGMVLKGIRRASQTSHIKKADKKWLEYIARNKKTQLENRRRARANRDYEF